MKEGFDHKRCKGGKEFYIDHQDQIVLNVHQPALGKALGIETLEGILGNLERYMADAFSPEGIAQLGGGVSADEFRARLAPYFAPEAPAAPAGEPDLPFRVAASVLEDDDPAPTVPEHK